MSELNKSKCCDLNYISGGETFFCKTPATVRIRRFTEREIITDDGKWEKESRPDEYLCALHFEHLYLNHPFYHRSYKKNRHRMNDEGIEIQLDTDLDLGDWTYTRFVSDVKTKGN